MLASRIMIVEDEGIIAMDIVEGVETEEQLTFLKAHQCEVLQGYLFSRPVAAGTLETDSSAHLSYGSYPLLSTTLK